MLGGDSRDDWDGRTMPDPRVIHFWDGEYVAGQGLQEKWMAIRASPGMYTISMDLMQPGMECQRLLPIQEGRFTVSVKGW